MKPFRDISNGVRSSKSVKIKKLPVSERHSIQNDASLDRLLLVHSDLSSLLRQTDELVVQVQKIDLTRKGLNEIESFTQVLSSIQTSLKPWVPRMQKALSNCSNHQSDIEEDSRDMIESPEELKESMISSSPLVSWQADFANEGGTQLFLLTPLPKPKSIASKLPLSIRRPSSLIAISRNTNDDLLESEGGIMATPNKASLVVMKPPCWKMSPPKSCVVLEPISEVTPPPKNNLTDRKSKLLLSRRRPSSLIAISRNTNDDLLESEGGIMATPTNKASLVVMTTPCWKMSPPKSCVVLEPISEVTLPKNNPADRKSTPFPVGINRCFSDSSESSSSDDEDDAFKDLALKYSKLMDGIVVQPEKLGHEKKRFDSSPYWCFSPPKTCIVLEPRDDDDLTAAKSINANIGVEKKHPGENTLKKELWSKFEAATNPTHSSICYIPPSTTQKRFIDRLEDASSCDESSL